MAMRISELAERAQVPASTVRYYERIGLLAPAQRLANGYRVYDEAAAEQLAFIARAKRMGMPLEEIAKLIELWASGGCRSLQERIRSFLNGRIDDVRRQLAELSTFERQLEGLLGRLADADQPEGGCELNCACVRLDDVGDVSAGCPKLIDPSDAVLAGWGGWVDGAPSRTDEWRDLVGVALRRERTDLGLRLVFATSASITGLLGALCEARAGAYPFLRFTLEVSSGEVAMVVEGPAMATGLIEQLFGCDVDRSAR